MTIEKLLNCSAAELKTFTTAQYEAWFEPYKKITRPELAEKPKNSGSVPLSSRSNKSPSMSAKMRQVAEMAKELGLKLDI